MFSSGFEIPRLISGGLIANYACPSACRHCLYNCGPGREKDYITAEAAEESLRAVRALGCRAVHIGGGEPLLRPAELGAVLDAARRAGVAVDYVETNASWFQDPGSAAALLSGLRGKGLHTLLVSISPFHNEHIPFSRTLGAMEACRAAGVRLFPWVADFVRDLSGLDPARPHALAEYEARYGRGYLRGIPGRYWIQLGGRALDCFRPVLRRKTLAQVLREGDGGCGRRLADTSHFHVDLFGNYVPGLCAGLAVRLGDAGRRLDAAAYPLLNRLASRGVRGLLEMAQAEFGFAPGREGYLNACDLCDEIRRFLFARGYDGSAELAPAGFYRPA